MRRLLEVFFTVALLGVVGVAKFGMPDNLPWSSAKEDVVDPQAAFDRRWGEQSMRQEVGAIASYRNCAAARAAGAAPIRYGEPGYGPHLDRDGDGVACEPYRGR